MNIIFAGSIGRFPVGGHAWVDMQYLLGLRSLGHKVFYLEECGPESWVYHWEMEQMTTELDYPTTYLQQCLTEIGFDSCWIYRAGEQSVGMNVADFLDVCAQADLLIVRGSPIPLWRPEYDLPKRRLFIDSDPGFTQIHLSHGDADLNNTVERCDRLFTVGQQVGAQGCSVPTLGKHWLKMFPPVFLPYWPVAEDKNATHFTVVMQWRSYREVTYEGNSYGNKDKEFPTFIDIPKLTQQPFRVALTSPHTIPEQLIEHHWDVVPGWAVSFTPESYQQFIQNSRAEFGIAKQGYVAMQTGWFSDRSLCYLASGRPVLLQDTGLSDYLPIGEGILTFRNLSEAVDGIAAINADYERHRQAARRLAEEYFDSNKVLTSILEAAMN
ncbi:glycosyltransferase [Brasilonema sp. UFV-L1]|uniref:glycosyltransferase n=1 Tax=Brasilonema sp. UFV-L1 TaxID=2234130 RepID=UPI00145D9EDA|nr:glycosyltransferase [Brasilonema sp. UFV-L1]NMG05375.1 glycosyltransferase family 1 protein [Brasilonema sp. UFV-L1]